ncbi:hypothetical protein K1719_032473 [Acacia pycnantha]|nr:hypothetical protein K1719_032473 [Acacia pycnantha]
MLVHCIKNPRGLVMFRQICSKNGKCRRAFWFDTQKKLRGLTEFRLGFLLLGLLSPFLCRAIPAYQRTPEQPSAISRFRSSPLPSISCQSCY